MFKQQDISTVSVVRCQLNGPSVQAWAKGDPSHVTQLHARYDFIIHMSNEKIWMKYQTTVNKYRDVTDVMVYEKSLAASSIYFQMDTRWGPQSIAKLP